MAGVAQIAKQAGFHVTGSDENVYPPMSTQLESSGIELISGYDPKQLRPAPDCVVIGNALSRGNPAVEYVLNHNIPYLSGPEWLFKHVLQSRWVLAVAGTHGKTTTTSLLAWILESAGLNPGFLIGGVTNNFDCSARLGGESFFVIEADEYDSAFFDKRSKFLHYHPRTLILNNLEFDHADIFSDLAAIQRQCHYLIRTVPESGLIIRGPEPSIDAVMAQGVWTEQQIIHQHWCATDIAEDGGAFTLMEQAHNHGRITWSLLGAHNIHNALAAIAAAKHVGITPAISIEALAAFKGIKRRMEVRGAVNQITVYDDFAHHPTAIKTTIDGLRNKVGKERILAVLDFASYTMRSGEHQHSVTPAVAAADEIYFAKPQGCDWPIEDLASEKIQVFNDTQRIIDDLIHRAKPKDHILIMSNRGFEGIHQRLLNALQAQYE